MRKTKNKASLRARVCVRCSQSSVWSQHLLRQNNSAQPQTRPITSTPLLRLQINLIRVYFVSSPFLPLVLVSTAAVPQNPHESRRVHWRTGGLGGASCVSLWRQQRSLILLSGRLLEPHSVLSSDWLALNSGYNEEAQNIRQNKGDISPCSCKTQTNEIWIKCGKKIKIHPKPCFIWGPAGAVLKHVWKRHYIFVFFTHLCSPKKWHWVCLLKMALMKSQ